MALADTNVTLPGRVSVRITPVAASGPVLVTLTVYAMVAPSV